MLLAMAASLSISAQNQSDVLKQADALIAAKKYETAFKELDNFDPDNKNPETVLKKQDILLNYFVTSMMHQMFALKDLEEHEDIMDYRGEEGQYSMYMFPSNEILEGLISENPENCRLYEALGDYYYDVYLRYGGNWLKSDEEVLSLAKANFTKAIEGRCEDYMSHYVLGYLELINENYTGSIPHFLKSIALDKNYPTSHYNLAYAYLYTDDRQNCIKYATNAMELYKDIGYKADAARMVAQAYHEMEDYKNAMDKYALSDNIEPDNYYTLKPLLLLYVKEKHPKAAATLSRFYNLAPENPTIYDDLEAIYGSNGVENELIDFYKAKLEEPGNTDKISGNLNFFMGSLHMPENKALAKEHLIKAKEIFAKVFDPGHEVFGIIEEGIKQADSNP